MFSASRKLAALKIGRLFNKSLDKYVVVLQIYNGNAMYVEYERYKHYLVRDADYWLVEEYGYGSDDLYWLSPILYSKLRHQIKIDKSLDKLLK